MGAGGSRPINNQSKVVLVKGSDEGKTIDFVTASSASEERKDDRDSPDDESIVQPFTSFETVPEPPRGASWRNRASGLMKALQTLRIVETRWAACFCRGAQ